MKKFFILLLCVIPVSGVYAQYYSESIDSTIAGIQLSGSDWLIAVTIDHAGGVPIYDSLGNLLDQDPDGTYLITQINNECILRKFVRSYGNDLQPVDTLSKLIKLNNKTLCSYTKDSIQKAGTEWIYPNIYKNDRLKTYDIQANGNHDLNFRIFFRTRDSTAFTRFGEVDIFNSWSALFKHKNLNYEYNTSTLTYRIFMHVIDLLKDTFKIRIPY